MDWWGIIKEGRKLLPSDAVDVAKLAAWWSGKSPGVQAAKRFVKKVQDEEKRRQKRNIAIAFAAGYMAGRAK